MEATMDLFESKTITEQMKAMYNRIVQLESILLCRNLLPAAPVEEITPQRAAYLALQEYEDLYGLNFRAVAAIIRNRSEWGELKSPKHKALSHFYNNEGNDVWNRTQEQFRPVLSDNKAAILVEILRSITNI